MIPAGPTRTIFLGLFATAICAAQNITGTILGSVSDTTGAVVPAAKVSVTNADTSQSSETATDSAGRYEVPLLKPGKYGISVSAAGFQTLDRQGIRLTVGDRLRVDLTLHVGQISERVTVNERAELVESGTASLSTTLGARSIEDLPLKGRYVLQYAALTPGVQINPFAVNAGGGGLTNADFSVNGGRYRSNELLVDGVSSSQPKNNDFGVLPLPEGVVEMKIHTNSFSAEYGRTGGGVFNVITRGGTNQFHGSVFHFHQNDNLNANAWFANNRGQSKGNFRRNLFGGSAGGPVVRNKTFFYADYQGARNSSAGSTGATTIPTREQFAGDFSQTLNRTGQPVLIYDPVTTRISGAGRIRDPFPGNRIPTIRIDRVTANVIRLYPQPNRPGIGPANVNNYVFQTPAKSQGRQYTARVDHEFASHHRLFGRYTTSKGSNRGFGEYGTAGDTQLGFNPGSPEYNTSLNDTYTFSPTLLLNSRLGFTRGASQRRPLHENVSLAELGFPAFLDRDKEDSSLPGFRPANYAGLGPQAGDRIRLANDIWHLASDVTSIRGRHSLKWGGEARMYNQNLYQAQSPSGQFSFALGTTQGPDPQRATLTAGDGFASFLLGVGAGSISNSPRLAVRNFYWALFVNDDIRVTRSLTLNLGLRYEYATRIEEVDGFTSQLINITDPTPTVGPLYGGPPTNLALSPRIGFAWSPDEGKSSLRGGFGVFYEHPNLF
ncbi:MAG: carboxypeptidase regulatory-like domain-containing protein, partial [Bryobacteraceae bacterium]